MQKIFTGKWIIGLALFLAAAGQAVLCSGAEEGEKFFLWKIQSGAHTGFLLGSVHVLDNIGYQSDPKINHAFHEARKLVFETDLDQLDSPQTQQLILARGLYPDGRTLQQSVSPETFSLVKKYSEDLGLPVDSLDRFRPWFCALTLASLKLQQIGFDAENGVDRYFFRKARAAGKDLAGLETVSFQIDLFARLSEEDQEQMLMQTLKDLELAEQQVDDIIASWSAGATDKLENLLLDSFREYPEIYRKLVLQRNLKWTEQIDEMLKKGEKIMVVVGAAHLVGRDGLIHLLQARGYRVEQQ